MLNTLNTIDNEYKSLSIYSHAFSLYGSAFSGIVSLKQSHIDTLSVYLANANAQIPANAYINNAPLVLSGDFISDIDALIAHENDNISFYNSAIATEIDTNVLDSLYLFQAHSYNDILQALQSAKILSQGFSAQNGANLSNLSNLAQNLGTNVLNSSVLNELGKAKGLIDEASQIMAKMQNNELSQVELEGFLGRLLGGLNYSLIGGALLGALVAIMLNNANKQKE